MVDPYQTLGVARGADAGAIRKAYRELARQYHPDVNPGNAAAEDRFKEISAAFEILGDPERRKAFDEFGAESQRSGFDPEKARAYRAWQASREETGHPFEAEGFRFDPRDLGDLGDLGDLFAGFRGRRGGAMRGFDVRAPVELDLPTAIRGARIEVGVPGAGGEPGGRRHKIRIPPGADDGDTLRIEGKGGPGRGGGPPGDLIIEIAVRPHPRVRRDGRDLHLTVPVTLAEAYAGATIEVPTFDGPVAVKVPPGSQPASKLRLRGKGIERSGRRGDFYVELQLELPPAGDRELEAALERAASLYARPIRQEVKL